MVGSKSLGMTKLKDVSVLYNIQAINQDEKNYLVNLCRNMMYCDTDMYTRLFTTKLRECAARFKQGSFEHETIMNMVWR